MPCSSFTCLERCQMLQFLVRIVLLLTGGIPICYYTRGITKFCNVLFSYISKLERVPIFCSQFTMLNLLISVQFDQHIIFFFLLFEGLDYHDVRLVPLMKVIARIIKCSDRHWLIIGNLGSNWINFFFVVDRVFPYTFGAYLFVWVW